MRNIMYELHISQKLLKFRINFYMEAQAMTKADLVATISEKLEEQKKSITPIVEEVFNTIKSALGKGEKCAFVGFGVFEVKNRAARKGRNLQNPSKSVKIPARKVPVFRPSKGLKEKVLAMKKL
jgi:DNA-binding protein HU-beta